MSRARKRPEIAGRAALLPGESFQLSMSNELRGPAIEPREIAQQGDAGLRITWADERVCHYTAPALRAVCPCAQCVNEWTGERVLRPETVSPDLTIADLNVVGRYALSFRWSDGHEHGIYSFKYLRELCEQG